METFNNHLPLIYTYGMPNESFIDDEIKRVEEHVEKLKKMRLLAHLSEVIIKNNIDARFKFHKLHDSVGIIKPYDVHLECEFSYELTEENGKIVSKLESLLRENMFDLFKPYIDFKKCYILNTHTMIEFCQNFFSKQDAIQITQGFIDSEKKQLESNLTHHSNEGKSFKI